MCHSNSYDYSLLFLKNGAEQAEDMAQLLQTEWGTLGCSSYKEYMMKNPKLKLDRKKES